MSGTFGWFASFGAWNWFILGLVLFTLEMGVPGVHFLWFGVAAFLTGGIALLTGITWPLQVVAFGALAFAVVLTVRRFARPDMVTSDQPDLNDRGQQYVGRSVLVEVPIENGRGKVRVGDTVWSAEGPDAPVGAHVTVTGTRGIVLVVAPAAAS
jgi:membrane protein implicated in regulation of membrane protease activity